MITIKVYIIFNLKANFFLKMKRINLSNQYIKLILNKEKNYDMLLKELNDKDNH